MAARLTHAPHHSPSRSIAIIDDREYCIVPSCGVRSRTLTKDGMCEPFLWDLKHDRYYAALRLPRTRRSA